MGYSTTEIRLEPDFKQTPVLIGIEYLLLEYIEHHEKPGERIAIPFERFMIDGIPGHTDAFRIRARNNSPFHSEYETTGVVINADQIFVMSGKISSKPQAPIHVVALKITRVREPDRFRFPVSHKLVMIHKQ